jgi:UDP-N-acetylglucosamine:LPS N-acetylglucosamine transferase
MTRRRPGFHTGVTGPSNPASNMASRMRTAPEVLLIVVDAGGGHRAAANALLAAAAERGLPWKIEVLNITDVLAPQDFLRRLTGHSLEDAYNAMIRRRLTRHLVPLLRGYQWLIARLRPALVRTVAARLADRRPELVVSLFPNLNGVLAEAVHLAHPGVPLWVALTDFADFPPHFWMEPEVDRVLVATTRAEEQARAVGLAGPRLERLSGMILHPRFHRVDREAARRAIRRELGIPDGALAVLVLFGGKGSPEVEPLSEALLERSPAWHVVAICGDNPGLHGCLTRLAARHRGRLHALGFTDRVADYLCACDVLASKPGPGTLAEAFHCRIPVVAPCNAYTIPQERYNATLLEEHELGMVVRHWTEIPDAVALLAGDPRRRERMRARLQALPENRAVYEVLDLVECALDARGAGSVSEAAAAAR